MRPRAPHAAWCLNWINLLKDLDMEPRVSVLEEFDPTGDVDDRLNEAERKWIRAYRDAGARLTNLTDGGEMGRKFHPSVLQKMSEKRKGPMNHFFGKTHDEKALLKMRSKVVCLDDGSIFPGLNIAAAHYGVAASSLSLVCNGKRRRVGGRRFAFVND